MARSKLIVADCTLGYSGSANFTRSGLDPGMEAGELVEGMTAAACAGCAHALLDACKLWSKERNLLAA